MNSEMKIGVFDSGLGGLFVYRSIIKTLPGYDYIYLGDTLRVPYGNRSPETVFEFTEAAVDFLFKKDCALIILACNTASALALRKIQKEYLPKNYPKRRVLGVLIPTVEAVAGNPKIKTVGVLATQGTMESGAYVREFKKRAPKIKVLQKAAPLLVPLVENDGLKWAGPVIKEYLKSFSGPERNSPSQCPSGARLRASVVSYGVDALVLGCTHYSALEKEIKKITGKKVEIISQDKAVPPRLKNYLSRHPEIEKQLGKNSKRELLVTDITPFYQKLAKKWFGAGAKIKLVNY